MTPLQQHLSYQPMHVADLKINSGDPFLNLIIDKRVGIVLAQACWPLLILLFDG